MELHNTYYLVRHGNSLANQAGKIEAGTLEEWGLSDLGKQQAHAAGDTLRERLGQQPQAPLVLASPFSRTLQTAQLIVERLGHDVAVQVQAQNQAQPAPELRERDFGALDGGSDASYLAEWSRDAEDTDYKAGGTGESVAEVARRATSLLRRLEDEHSGRSVILVAHGDSISILAAAVLGPGLAHHRQYALENCGVLCLGPGGEGPSGQQADPAPGPAA
ncbi:hypothetical protein APUTEX25_003845 [Auxenochlorella protothecoides]|uniref:Uncharacterized protein n=1 Tax=Auxenochlorella protothecoides TaxID=3075 RepID=A0A3M7L0Z3_AUXPR|nr:hypothetical protein APUTEX25_003845 [Auxenochlorella protothecoides]|eukprot:RMZ55879.1 hypothetical protein APUTEX25_003845 [Auxenochlorella protothecoides]